MTQWQGCVKLNYAVDHQQTHLRSAYSRAPLRIQRPFYPESPQVCHSVLVHTAGGMVGGDRLDLDVTLQPQAHTLLTTSAAGKVYRTQGQTVQQSLRVTLEEQSILEWLPQETIVFEGAQFDQQTHVDLGSGALWVGMDLFRFGRTARGEGFTTGHWRSRTEVWQQGHPLWIDRAQFSPAMVQSPTVLANYCVMGSLAVVGTVFAKEAINQIREACLPQLPVDHQIGMTRLQAGVICRYLGHSTHQGRSYFLKIWENLRQSYAGRGICIPRVWQVLVS
ncbi:urease accessory protein UreD [Lyngbya confervoides]|uniref:Urease accessory protein UreD n=1 Tax=Lyngbya confervoides BDU141951 TaxID=1574623 RepID=A0ABD4T2R7_9CYAN|nr:urease accessory protein UreD [Lyngbya confervoides]MCM1982837.1 urease accessory protein UreD [Lyngbya confervoides BDU141951]